MALLKCNDCGSDMSDQAEKCPHCGAPNPHYNIDQPKAGETYLPCFKHNNLKGSYVCKECGKRMCNECVRTARFYNDNTVKCSSCHLDYLKWCKKTTKKLIIFSSLALVWYLLWWYEIAHTLITRTVDNGLYGELFAILFFATIVPVGLAMARNKSASSQERLFIAEKQYGLFGGTKYIITDESAGIMILIKLAFIVLISPISIIYLTIKNILNIIRGKKDLKETQVEIDKYEQIVANDLAK